MVGGRGLSDGALAACATGRQFGRGQSGCRLPPPPALDNGEPGQARDRERAGDVHVEPQAQEIYFDESTRSDSSKIRNAE